VRIARPVRRAAWGNGPGAIQAPRPRPTQPFRRLSQGDYRGRASASSVRDLIPSFVWTLRRWYSTVFGLRNNVWPFRPMSHSPRAQAGHGTGSGLRTIPTTRSPAARSEPAGRVPHAFEVLMAPGRTHPPGPGRMLPRQSPDRCRTSPPPPQPGPGPPPAPGQGRPPPQMHTGVLCGHPTTGVGRFPNLAGGAAGPATRETLHYCRHA